MGRTVRCPDCGHFLNHIDSEHECTKLPLPPREELVELYVNQRLPYAKIGARYGVASSTIWKWVNHYGIETRQYEKVYLKDVDGQIYKRCNGPLHQGLFVPIEKFYKRTERKNGRDYRCATCLGQSRMVPFTQEYEMWLESIVRRLGKTEAARRLDISYGTLWKWYTGKDRPKHLQRRHARRLVEVLVEVVQTGELRHKDSIRYGSVKRGREEKKVTKNADLYVRNSDDENEARVRWRRNNPEREREIANAESERRKVKRIVDRERREGVQMKENVDPQEYYSGLKAVQDSVSRSMTLRETQDYCWEKGIDIVATGRLSTSLLDSNGGNGNGNGHTEALAPLPLTTE